MIKYQSTLCENSYIWLEAVQTLNLATLLLIDSGLLEPDYLEVMAEVFLSWPDLTNQPTGHPDVEYSTDSSSFIRDCTRFAGYVIVTLNSVTEAHPPLVVTSAQKAELVALTWALKLAAGVGVNIYTDSKYAFTTIHVHGALYKERGLINLGGKVSSMGRKSSNC
jgi:hypothetical protein